MSETKRSHWQAVPCGELAPGWEKVPAAAVYFHPATGRILVAGSPDPEPPNEEGHSCDEMGCSSVGAHNLLWAVVTSPEDLKP